LKEAYFFYDEGLFAPPQSSSWRTTPSWLFAATYLIYSQLPSIAVKQIEVHTAEILVPDPSRLEVEIAIAKLKEYKSPGSGQIPAELIQGGGEILLSAIHKLINSVWNKEELPDQWKEYIIVPIHHNLTVIIILGYHCYQLHTKYCRISLSQG
jgi:hypothetical protein